MGRVTFLNACAVAFVAVIIIGYANTGWAQSSRGLIPETGITNIKTLKQNWPDDEAVQFYNAAQGSQLLPYRWFLHLEQAESTKLFRDAENIRKLGYLPRSATPDNPDGLPIGFIKDAAYGNGEAALGVTCAACHTTQINHGNIAYLIDGAPTLGDLEALQRELVAALAATIAEQAKFDRFAAANGALSPTDRNALKARLTDALAERVAYNQRNLSDLARLDVTPQFGPGRVDAFGAILNEVTVKFIGIKQNHRFATAPVSYPFLWDAPQHDRVQWNGAAQNDISILALPVLGTIHVGALGRNAGEVLGVFGSVNVQNPVGLSGSYASTVNQPNLINIEESLRRLWSPQWPGEFPALKGALVTSGKQIFDAHCADCHRHIDRKDPGRRVVAQMKSVETDDTMASNFATRTALTGVLAGRTRQLNPFDLLGTTEPGGEVLKHVVQRALLGPQLDPAALSQDQLESLAINMPVEIEIESDNRIFTGEFKGLQVATEEAVGGGVTVTFRADSNLMLTEADHPEGLALRFNPADNSYSWKGGERLELPNLSQQVTGLENVAAATESTTLQLTNATIRYKYKGRPLNGIWATAPYLHNGSVPNLRELLKLAANRKPEFFVGSREFDADNVGLKSDAGPFQFDTTIPGNSNAGHEYGANLSETQVEALLEYLKSI